MKILGLHHVAIATDSLMRHSSIFENLFGLKATPAEIYLANDLKLAFVDAANIEIEFLEPVGLNSPISKFLEKRGPGIHHICLLVEDITAALSELRRKNVKLVDEKPRAGADNSLIAFIHPESTGGILIELRQSKS